MDAPVNPDHAGPVVAQEIVRRPWYSILWRLAWRLFVVLFIAQCLYILLLRWVNPPITFTQLQSWMSGDGLARAYVSWEDISGETKLAIIASEDQLFFVHNGFDWKSIQEAMEKNKKSRRVRG